MYHSRAAQCLLADLEETRLLLTLKDAGTQGYSYWPRSS
jgi:hypothetical protein